MPRWCIRTMLVLVLGGLGAAPAHAMPGDPPIEVLEPADGATLPVADVIATRFTCPVYRSDEQIDNSVEQPGQLLLFDVATALPIRELTPGPSDRYPSFSPDGRRVMFERSGSVRTIGVNGGRARRVVRGVQPTWGRY